jgi:hypothetical protein
MDVYGKVSVKLWVGGRVGTVVKSVVLAREYAVTRELAKEFFNQFKEANPHLPVTALSCEWSPDKEYL